MQGSGLREGAFCIVGAWCEPRASHIDVCNGIIDWAMADLAVAFDISMRFHDLMVGRVGWSLPVQQRRCCIVFYESRDRICIVLAAVLHMSLVFPSPKTPSFVLVCHLRSANILSSTKGPSSMRPDTTMLNKEYSPV